MKILFVSRYVDPAPVGSNKNVFLQARGLKEKLNIDVSILTWPHNDLWKGPIPEPSLQIPATTCERSGITYHVITAPELWNEMASGDSLDDATWEAAVAYGMRLLAALAPDIVHLQHRHGFWWILDSAQRLGIKTVYSNHDWGMACLRTVLVKGDQTLCDAVVEVKKCADCVKSGRGTLGALNEKLVSYDVGVSLLAALKKLGMGSVLKQRGIVTRPAAARTSDNLKRVKRVVSKLSHCITPSNFGKNFFSQFGLATNAITVLPWYYDVSVKEPVGLAQAQPFTITYIGRLSPEKGVHQVFDALKDLNDIDPITFRIAGAVDSEYAKNLQEKYSSNIGKHSIEWLGWMTVDGLYQTTDVSIIPSLLMDNTPLSLVESLAYRVPVIATRVAPIAEFLQENSTGFMAEYGSNASLADAIRRAHRMKTAIRAKQISFPDIMSLEQYVAQVSTVYRTLM